MSHKDLSSYPLGSNLILGTTRAVQPFQNCALAPEHLAIINVERLACKQAENRVRRDARRSVRAPLGRTCDGALLGVCLLLEVVRDDV